MIKAVEDAFTIVHIRISNVRVFGIRARHLITGTLVVFLIFNTIQFFSTIFRTDYLKFIESSIFIILTVYFCLAWITSWPKAGKLLNKASEYEEEHNNKK